MIYLDHAATTPTDKRVLQKMLPYFCEVYGNGNSQHAIGREASKAIEEARRTIAAILGAKASEIYFTSGGTESNNWAIMGAATARAKNGKNHIITSKIEHPSVRNVCKYLEKNGFDVTYLDVDNEGFVSVEAVEKAITDKTALITIMTANNEIGTIEPIAEIGAIAKKHGVLFHTDAVQAAGTLPLDVTQLQCDFMSISGHKFYGPKGIGVLYKRNGVKVEKLLHGGEQERDLRGGTLNTTGIVGLAEALRLSVEEMQDRNKYVAALRDSFLQGVKQIPYIDINGAKDMTKRLPNNASVSFEFVEGESILLRLDLEGIAVSSGSACSSGSLEPSYVLLATGLPIEKAHGTIRFTFGSDNTQEQVDFTLEKLKANIEALRVMSPLFKRIQGDEFNV